MANVRVSTAGINAACDALVDLLDAGAGAGVCKIYDGTQPADANTAITTQNLLATLTFSDPAFGSAVAGVATADTITADSSADATGTATWARNEDSDGNVIFDCDVGTSGSTIVLDSVAIEAGANVSISSFTVTHPDGT